MTTQHADGTAQVTRRPRRIGRGTLLVLGVLVVPWALTILCNSWGPLTADGAVRMAFGAVAGMTVTIISAVVAVVLTIRRGYPWSSIAGVGVVAALIVMWAVGSMASAEDTLLQRLELVSEVDRLNR